MKRLSVFGAFMAAVFLTLSIYSCKGESTVIYRDGYIQIIDIEPKSITAVNIELTAGEGTYRQQITVAVNDGKSEKFCLGEMYRRTYSKGEIRITAYEGSKAVVTATNKEAISLDGSKETQTIPYSDFERQ